MRITIEGQNVLETIFQQIKTSKLIKYMFSSLALGLQNTLQRVRFIVSAETKTGVEKSPT